MYDVQAIDVVCNFQLDDPEVRAAYLGGDLGQADGEAEGAQQDSPQTR